MMPFIIRGVWVRMARWVFLITVVERVFNFSLTMVKTCAGFLFLKTGRVKNHQTPNNMTMVATTPLKNQNPDITTSRHHTTRLKKLFWSANHFPTRCIDGLLYKYR